MELTNSFTVDLPVDRTWEVITDLERVAPCLPGGTEIRIDTDLALAGRVAQFGRGVIADVHEITAVRR